MDFPVADVVLPEHLEAPAALMEIVNMRGKAEGEDDVGGGIRIRAIRQEALRLGAQTGLAERYSMIMEFMDKTEHRLNVTFNFSGFVRDGRLLVPAIAETTSRLTANHDDGSLTHVSKTYTIEEEARLVTSIPTWRDYLFQVYQYPEKPHHSLLPRNKKEEEVWKSAVIEGWGAGVNQADMIYQDRMNRLTKAVEGRHLYRTLEAKNVISPAALQIQENKITFNGRSMNIGEVIYNVSNPSEFKASEGWEPVWTK